MSHLGQLRLKDALQDKRMSGMEAGVEIKRSDQRFEGIHQEGTLPAAAAPLLTLAEMKVFAYVQFAGRTSKRRALTMWARSFDSSPS